MVEDIYVRWNNISDFIVNNNISNWKSHSDVNYMLEHVSYNDAIVYFNQVKNELSIDIIQLLANYNDIIGGSQLYNFNGIKSSPSSIRYISHALDICKQIEKNGLQKSVSIIEVGAGYGGLALITIELCKLKNINVNKYIIYDIPGAGKLQRYFLSKHFVNGELNNKIIWNDSSSFGRDLDIINQPYFLVSNYCMAEIDMKFRKQYLENLIPKISGAFMAWNSKSLEGLPSNIDLQDEVPDTSHGNKNKIVRL
jgi:hypothetical protein